MGRRRNAFMGKLSSHYPNELLHMRDKNMLYNHLTVCLLKY